MQCCRTMRRRGRRTILISIWKDKHLLQRVQQCNNRRKFSRLKAPCCWKQINLGNPWLPLLSIFLGANVDKPPWSKVLTSNCNCRAVLMSPLNLSPQTIVICVVITIGTLTTWFHCVSVVAVAKQANATGNKLRPWASEGFFSRGTIVDFSRDSQKDVSRGESSEITFNPLETKKTTFFANNLIGKCQISKSRGKGPLPPLSDAHDCDLCCWSYLSVRKIREPCSAIRYWVSPVPRSAL